MASDAALEVLGWQDDHIVALDQTALPHEVRMLHLTTVADLVDAITRLAIRGAPVLGAAGALGVALAARLAQRDGWDPAHLDAAVKQIAEARPTAVNLRRETEAVAAMLPQGPDAVTAAALAIVRDTVTASHRMSERGARYLRDLCGPAPLRIETHCNTGSLACLGWGSALGVMRALNNDDALAHVLVDETRPLLQGARLTCWELGQLAIEHYLVPDAAGPFLISQGLVDAVVPAVQVYDTARAMAAKFAKGPALALAAAKAAIDGGLDGDLASGLRLESHLFASLFATEDRTIGMASFLESGPGKAVFT